MRALLAALSAEAGVPFLMPEAGAPAPSAPAAAPAPIAAATPSADLPPALCLRAGFGLSTSVMAGNGLTVEHGLIGCKTETAGLPITVSDDPALPPPPASRPGDYSLSLSLHYRLLERSHLHITATLADQALAYGLGSPLTGNNLLASMSMQF